MKRLVLVVAAALAVLFALGAPAEAAPAEGGPYVNWFDFGYKGKTHPDGAPVSPPFVLALINFGLLLTLLGFTAAPAIARYLDKRHVTIKEALEESARLRDEAKLKLEDYQKRIAAVEDEVDALIAGIRADAEAEKKIILERAAAQAKLLRVDAEKRIAADLARARRELEVEVVAAAVAAAEKLMRERTTPADQKRLAEYFITELGKDGGTGEVTR
jgi:F-type H+-transporting ATPase subunit b